MTHRWRPLVAVVALLGAHVAAIAATPAPAPDTLSRIRAAHRIAIAFSGDSPPFSSVGEGNAAVGYSIDICRKVVASIGMGLGMPDLKVDWRVGTVAERLAMIEKGQADLDCANTSETLERLARVDFSNRVFIDAGGLLVKGSSRIDRLADLANRKIGVIGGTTTEARLRATLKERLVNATVITVREGPEGSAMLEAGSLDAFAGDKIKLVGLAAQAKDPKKLALLAEDLSFEPYGLAIPRNDSAYRLEVNKALTQIYMGGEIEPIFAAWLGKLGRPSSLLAAMYLLYSIPD